MKESLQYYATAWYKVENVGIIQVGEGGNLHDKLEIFLPYPQ